VIISLADLGLTKEQSEENITALARMFGVSNEKAAEIAKANPYGIQLGTGKGITVSGDKNDYADALRYTLTAEGIRTVTEMGNALFNGMTTDERADYLKRQYIIGSAFIGDDKGTIAAQLRDLEGLHNFDTLYALFYSGVASPAHPSDTDTMDYIHASTYDFMNEPLRDFLNLNLNGSSRYTLKDISDQKFSEMFFPGNLYHLNSNYTNVKKYTSADGREVIRGVSQGTEISEQINSELYRGTYNYGKGIAHYLFDMRPFDVQHNYNLFTPSSILKDYRDADSAYNYDKLQKALKYVNSSALPFGLMFNWPPH
jgi:hypothetical protein